ncbi:hypothetical protein SAMN05216431_10822 [Ligilactobacillus sp. WC1T17]|uniref:Transposase n=2 Tax=Ligilactobacillus TaxID=2767887 RepID=A0ABY1AC48_9LACO|nr:hypothetical protein SAMN05216431_10822 [Ligilactobacillus ruminis]
MNRYVKPQSVHEAMELIQKLFNQYRHAPLTKELMAYHQNLATRLQTDIWREALRENNQKQLADLAEMIVAMQTWTQTRMSGRPFEGKMKHFRITTPGVSIKQHVHKIKGSHNYRTPKH